MDRLQRDVERVARQVLNAYHRRRFEADFFGTHEEVRRQVLQVTKQAFDDLAAVLADHYVTAIDCNHGKKTDTVRCSCSKWTGTPQLSVGAAVRQWILHVIVLAKQKENQEVTP